MSKSPTPAQADARKNENAKTLLLLAKTGRQAAKDAITIKGGKK